MRYTIYSTWTPAVASTSTCGTDTLQWTAGVRWTAAAICDRLSATFGDTVTVALNNATGTVGFVWHNEETDLDLGGDPTLRTFLGLFAALVDNGTESAPNPCLGHWHGQVASPWGGRTTRKSQDVGSQWGRNRAAENCIETTGSMKLWVHRRDSTTTFAADLLGCYSLSDLWVRNPIEIVDQYGNSTTHTIADSWECAPELLDAQTVTLTVETSKWES